MVSSRVVCIATPLAIYGAILISRHFRKSAEIRRKLELQKKEHFDVHFFGGKTKECKDHINGQPCCKDCPLQIYRLFQDLIGSARSTIDVCINVFTSEDIALALIKAHRKNIQVRIIADKDMSTNNGSKIHLLLKYGIDVKMPSMNHSMHSKLLIVDRKTIVTGSANFTNQGLTLNWENIIFTNQKDMVKDAVAHFDHSWSNKESVPFEAKF